MPLLGTGSSHNTGRFKRNSRGGRKPLENTTVVCQKCLQKGHWTYQCKNEAAYTSRPTRTKQLLRPSKQRKYLDPAEVPDEFKSGNPKEDAREKKKETTSSSYSSMSSKSSSYYSSDSRSSSYSDSYSSSSYSSYSTSSSNNSHSDSSDDEE